MSDRRRPVVQICHGCGEAMRDCECGNWRPAASMFDDPDEPEEDDDDDAA